MRKFVIKVKYGGLGDHILHSHLPRIAKEQAGFDKVFISNYSEYRNSETKKLVWEYHPYVDGFIDEDAPYPNFSSVPEGKNILDAFVDFFDLPDDGTRFREPELYYHPKFQSSYEDLTIYDPNYISNAGHPKVSLIAEYFQRNDIRIDRQMKSMGSNLSLSNIPTLEIKGLEAFCDLIHSCKAFYCLTSGSATLAAALQKPVTVLYSTTNPMFHHSKRNQYIKLT